MRLTRGQAQTRRDNHTRAASLPVLGYLTARDTPLTSVQVNPPRRVRCPELGDVVNLDELKDGPRRLLELLHALGVYVVAVKGYAVCPTQVTYHQSQELLAFKLGVTTKSVQRWTRELEALRYVDTRAHYGGSKHAARVDGLVVAVILKPGHRAHLHHDDLSHQWRNLNADRQAGRTAWAAREVLMSESKKTREGRIFQVLQDWAVTGSFTDNPFWTDSDMGSNTVLDVVYTLPLLGDVPTQHRAALVGKLATTLAHGLNDHHSAAWYASLIWRALHAERDGLTALQPLAALLARLWTDCEEWPALQRPGALLASRLRPTAV